MPKFLEDKLKAEYGNNPAAVFGTMNRLGLMRGNKETPKGRAAQAKHDRKTRNADVENAATATRARKGFRLPGGVKPTLRMLTGVKPVKLDRPIKYHA